MQITHEQAVAALPAAVYELIANPTERPRWLAEVRTIDAPDRAVTTGEVFTGRSHVFLHDVTGLAHVLDVDAGTRVTEHVVVGIGIRSTWELTAGADGRTTVTGVLDVDLPGGLFARPERWLLKWRLGRMQQRSLRALARLAEGASSGPTRR